LTRDFFRLSNAKTTVKYGEGEKDDNSDPSKEFKATFHSSRIMIK